MDNLEKQMQPLDSEKKKKKKKKKKAIIPELKGQLEKSKVGQMMFKTAIRTHLDLSSLADKKASTMLNVNTLIITIALPFILPKLEMYPALVYPTGILLFTCILSIIYATMVTRPGKMTGFTTEETLKKGEGDLFFFGNFYKMNFTQYQQGIKYTLEDADNLDATVLRDLFFSGKALGVKYTRLRYCYSIFIMGLVSATIVAVIVLAIS